MIEQEIKNIEQLNTVANLLKENQEVDRIKKVAYEWLIPDEQVEDFLTGKRVLLADIDVEEKDYANANEKIAEETSLLADAYFADTIGLYLCRKCADKEYEALVLKPHKTLQKCLDYILHKVYEFGKEKYGEDGMRKSSGVGIAMEGNTVFAWVDEYYALDDEKEEAEKKAKAREDYLKMRAEKEENEKKQAEREKKRKKEQQERKDRQDEREAKKKAEKAQLSLFDMMEIDDDETEGKTDESKDVEEQGSQENMKNQILEKMKKEMD